MKCDECGREFTSPQQYKHRYSGRRVRGVPGGRLITKTVCRSAYLCDWQREQNKAALREYMCSPSYSGSSGDL